MDDEYIDAALERIDIIGQAGFLIYVTLHRYQDENGMIQTTQRDLTAVTGMSIATVNKAIGALRSSGLIAIQRHKHSVTTVQIIKSRNSKFDNTSTLLINNESIKEREVIKNRISEFDNLKNRNFTLADAGVLITNLTGWIRIPGNPDQATHALGVVQDIHDKHNSETIEYLRPFWLAFRERYPHSTQTFWLTDWAVQGVIPNKKKNTPNVKPGVIVPPEEYTAIEKKKAIQEEYKKQLEELEGRNADHLAD